MRPPFRADHVGSLLRPAEVKDAFRRHHAGEIDDAEFTAIQDAAIRDVVAHQERVGLGMATDGEFRRPSYWASFVAALDGLEVDVAQFDFRDDSGGTQSFTAPYVAGRIRRRGPIAGAEFDFLRSATTGATPKVTLPSPPTMHFWHDPSVLDASPYEGLEDAMGDLAAAYRGEIADLASRGAAYVQLDEVALAMLCDPEIRASVQRRGQDPDDLIGAYVDGINAALDQRPPGVTATMHLCRGNYKGRWMAQGGYEPIAERVFGEVRVDALFLEFDSERAGDFAPLRFVPEDKAVVLGLISSKTPTLEDADHLVGRLEEAGEHIPLDRLGLSPQCGFASTAGGNPLTEDDQWAKLSRAVEVAGRVWGSP